MLFNSYAFISIFLPIVLIGFFVLSRYHLTTASATWLILASLTFYGYWSPVYVLFLLASILVNFYLGQAIERHRGIPHLGRSLLVLGIGLNLSALGYFQYANFFIGTVNDLLSTHWSLGTIILPLGISFFTFTQLAYLVMPIVARSGGTDCSPMPCS